MTRTQRRKTQGKRNEQENVKKSFTGLSLTFQVAGHVYVISRRGIVQPRSSSGSIFLLFSMKVAGENPRPPTICDCPTEIKKKKKQM